MPKADILVGPAPPQARPPLAAPRPVSSSSPSDPSPPSLASAPDLATKAPADYGVDTTARLKVLKVAEPAKRSAGIKVPDVDTLIDKIKETGVIA